MAQITADAPILIAEFGHRVEGAALEKRHVGVQSTAWNDQKRKAVSGFFIVDSNIAAFVKRHAEAPDFLCRVSVYVARALAALGAGSECNE
jgi:hypothetical protein